MNTAKSKHLPEVKYRILQAVIVTATFAMILVSGINLFNQRPIENITIPLGASLILFGLLKISKIPKWRYPIKLFIMVFFGNIYLAVAWLTSPGSYSAMSFYAVLLIWITILLSEKPIEYLIPLTALIEMLFLLHYEPSKPLQYYVYSSSEARAFDLSVNFTVVILIIMYIMMTLNTYFEEEHRRLFNMSITDQLTGVYNRRYLFSRLEEVQYHANQSKKPFSLLMIDINHFKLINDTYGHSVGDEILINLGIILRKCCRKNDLPTRFGGDEFILILPDTTLGEAELVANRIREAFSKIAYEYARENLSLGIGITESGGQSIDDIIQQVDDHLYKDKQKMKAEMKKEG